MDNSDGIDPGISIAPNTGTPEAVSFYVRAKTGGMSEKVESGLVDLTFTIGYESTASENKLSLTGREAVEAGFTFGLRNGTYSIGSEGTEIPVSGDVIIPSSIDGIPVTRITSLGFGYNEGITSVVIPDSVTEIGSAAFSNCINLKSVTIPDSVTLMEDSIFETCTSLTDVNIPMSITSIERSMFYDCKNLANISIPSTITEIGDDAFNNSGLTLISIPNSVTAIGDYAFVSCVDLTSISIPASVASIGESAFANCESLTEINISSNNSNYMSVDGVLFNKDMTTLIQYPAGKTEPSYTVPVKANGDYVTGGVETIKDNAFSGNKYLTEINIPSRILTIEKYAFSDCDNLLKINIDNFKSAISTSSYQPWDAKNATVNWLQELPDIDINIPLDPLA